MLDISFTKIISLFSNLKLKDCDLPNLTSSYYINSLDMLGTIRTNSLFQPSSKLRMRWVHLYFLPLNLNINVIITGRNIN